MSTVNPSSSNSWTPGVWSVSHTDLPQLLPLQQSPNQSLNSSTTSPLELVTDVTFCWTEPASSAFVTGTFNSWEITIPLTKITTPERTQLWVAVKSLPPGDYQYKYIIDNIWRHAPDQPITYDERGIINNTLSVTLESCGDHTCFCASIQHQLNQLSVNTNHNSSNINTANNSTRNVDEYLVSMTPQTQKVFQKTTGVAYKYVEKNRDECEGDYEEYNKSFMHNPINARPFDVTVVSVKNLTDLRNRKEEETERMNGTLSRVPSVEDFRQKSTFRYDPSLQMYHDAAYAAALRNQGDDSMPRTAPNYASLVVSDPVVLAFSVRARLSTRDLGFDPSECHEGILISETDHLAMRTQERGLYKTVRGKLAVKRRKRVYFEMYVIQAAVGGGVCVGLCTKELPVSCLCGTRPNSVGFSSSGNLVRTVDGKESWTEFGTKLLENAKRFTMGVLVSIGDPDRDDQESGGEKSGSGMESVDAKVKFYVDGVEAGSVDYVFVGSMDVFPTLSLFARNARVFSVFEAEGMMYSHMLNEPGEIEALDGTPIVKDEQAAREWRNSITDLEKLC